MSDPHAHEPGTEPGATGADAERTASTSSRIRIEAPEGTDALLIAQAVVGPRWLLKAERKASANPFETHKPLASLYEIAQRAYRDMFARMLSAMNAYVLKHTDLVKSEAKRGRPLFTVQQIAELAQIIRDYHTGLTVHLFGREALPPAEVRRLVDTGILPKEALGILDDAFAYGQLLAEVNAHVEKGVARVPTMTLDGIKKRLKARPLPLTSDEEFAREWAKRSAATHVRGLGNRVSQDFETMAIEADAALRRKLQNAIRESLDENITRRESWRKLKSDLGHATEDWSRDFGRIAATEKQRAMQEGQTQALIRREGSPDSVLVAKVPTSAACDHCVRLHLTHGKGSRPRVFRLADLQANGTNVGVRAAEWKAVVGPTHPWCECALVHIPEGWGFDETGNLIPKRARKAWTLDHDLKKALSFGDSVPQHGVTVRVGDPEKLAVIDDVIARTPSGLFSRKTGVTLITTDHPSQNSHLEDHDFAYWTGNEIRLMQNLPVEKLRMVLEHEMGHVPNVYLMYKFGTVEKVREWHTSLDAISKREGYVTEYASRAPIENAAEVTRLYLYERPKLMLKFPRQFTFVHRDYRALIRPVSQAAVDEARDALRTDRAETRLTPKTERLDQ